MSLRIALAQLNPHEGQIDHNLARIRAARAEAATLGADLVVTPEFSIAGYPPETWSASTPSSPAAPRRSKPSHATPPMAALAMIVGARGRMATASTTPPS